MRDRERNPRATHVLAGSTGATFEHFTLEGDQKVS
jgi:hypothetical protein